MPAADDAYGFEWDSGLLDDVSRNNKSVDWDRVLAQKPPLLLFWYRCSREPLTALEFHDDLLTPGIVRPTIRHPSIPACSRSSSIPSAA